MSGRRKSNVFMFSSTSPLRVELTLLAMPVLAIALILALLPAHSTKTDDTGKVRLRVTSAIEPPDPELAREAVMRQEQIRFALSKVAKVSEIAIVAKPTDVSLAKDASLALVDEEKPASKPIYSRIRIAKAPRDIRPGKLRRTVKAKSLRKKKHSIALRRKKAVQDNWITASLKWPLATASKTIAPVKNTLVRTVSSAEDVLKNLRQKIL